MAPSDAALIYGLVALVLSAGPGALWRWVLRDNVYFNNVGWRYVSYAQFWVWGIVFISWLLAVSIPSESVQSQFRTVAWTSTFGPFFLNLLGIYYLFAWSCIDQKWEQYMAAGIFAAVDLGMAAF